MNWFLGYAYVSCTAVNFREHRAVNLNLTVEMKNYLRKNGLKLHTRNKFYVFSELLMF